MTWFINAEQIEAVHRKLLRDTRGAQGIRDRNARLRTISGQQPVPAAERQARHADASSPEPPTTGHRPEIQNGLGGQAGR